MLSTALHAKSQSVWAYGEKKHNGPLIGMPHTWAMVSLTCMWTKWVLPASKTNTWHIISGPVNTWAYLMLGPLGCTSFAKLGPNPARHLAKWQAKQIELKLTRLDASGNPNHLEGCENDPFFLPMVRLICANPRLPNKLLTAQSFAITAHHINPVVLPSYWQSNAKWGGLPLHWQSFTWASWIQLPKGFFLKIPTLNVSNVFLT